MTQVFISYSRKDLPFVEQLAADLKNAGLDVWYDLSNLVGGSRWRKEIEAGIKKSRYVIVVLSPDSVDSQWVDREFLYASNRQRKIIPLLYRPCELPINYLDLNYIDVQGENYREHFDELLQALGVDPTGAAPASLLKTRHVALTGAVALFLIAAGIILYISRPGGIATPQPVGPTFTPTSTATETPSPTPTDTATPTVTPPGDPTTGPSPEPPNDSPPTEVTPPTDTDPPALSSPSAYTTDPPNIDGAMTKRFWSGAVKAAKIKAADDTLGQLYYLNNREYLYLLVDITGDTENNLHDKKSWDNLLIVFDANENGKQDPRDVYYSYSGRLPSFVRCDGVGPVSDDLCDFKEESLTSWARSGFDISPNYKEARHKFWELQIDLDEIGGMPGQYIHVGVATEQDGMSPKAINSMPQASVFSPDSFDFSHLIQIYLSDHPSP